MDYNAQDNKEILVAYIAAYCGEFRVCTPKEIDKVFRKLGYPVPEYIDALISRLRTQGWLQGARMLLEGQRIRIADRWHLAMLGRLYTDEDKKDWLTAIESVRFTEDPKRTEEKDFRIWLLDISGLRKNEDGHQIYPTFSWTNMKIIEPVMDMQTWAPAIESLSCDGFANAAMECVYKRFVSGEQVDWAQLQKLMDSECFRNISESTVMGYGHFGGAYLREFMHVFRFLMTGEETKEELAENKWGYMYKAVTEAYNQQYALAVGHFRQALKVWTQVTNKDRVAFDHFVFNYLYVITLMLDHSRESKDALDTIKESSFLAVDKLYRSSLVPFVKYIKDALPFHTDGYYNMDVKFDAPSASLIDGMMRFVYKTDQSYCRHYEKPNYALMLFEDDENMSLLKKLHVCQPWEVVMDGLDLHDFGHKEENEDEPQRIVYMVDTDGDIVPMIQKQNRQGNWGEGLRKLWAQAKERDLPDFATDEDRKILMQLPMGKTRFSGAEGMMVFVGCKKVLRRAIIKGEGLQQVNIRIEKPYLIVDEHSDGSFGVSSNVTLSDLDSERDTFVCRRDENNYDIMQLGARERPAFRLLLQVGNMPSSAKSRLMKLLERLKSCTDIHSTLMEGELAPMEGDPRVVVRVYPRQHHAGSWAMRLRVIPCIVNGFTELPAEGRTLYVVTNAEGQRVQLKRDFELETLNHHKFLDFYSELFDVSNNGNAPDYAYLSEICNDKDFNLEMLLAIVEWVQQHPDTAILEVMNGAKFRVKGYASMGRINILSAKKHGWFLMEGEVKLNKDKVDSLADFINRLDEGIGDYIRLDEETFVRMTNELKKKVQLLKAVVQKYNGAIMTHQSAIASLDAVFGDTLEAKDQTVRNIRHQIHAGSNEAITISDDLKATLKSYQMEGFKWMARLSKWAGGACLADDMGLGKTLQAIALMLHMQAQGPVLVVAPTSVVANWRSELQRFAPSLETRMLCAGADKDDVLDGLGPGTVVVTSYGIMLSAQLHLARVKWSIVCLDEAHVIKNPATKTHKAATSLDAEFRLVLTGTPVQNNLIDMWSLFQFILPGLLGPFKSFKNRYIDLEAGMGATEERIASLRKVVTPFILRRTKAQVLTELPEIQESVRHVQLSPDELILYEVTRKQTKNSMNTLINTISNSRGCRMDVLSMLTTLREIPCSCSLVMPTWNKRSSKEEALVELLNEIDLQHDGVLVFSQFTSFLTEVRHVLAEEGIGTLYLDGSVPQKERWRMVEQFQSGEGPSVFLISLKAGGVGLNLTRANYVIHMDPWWNPSIEQQATDRVYRIGQQNPVTVYHLIAEHTIEEKILSLHESKRYISDTVLQDAHQSTSLTIDDICALLDDNFVG